MNIAPEYKELIEASYKYHMWLPYNPKAFPITLKIIDYWEIAKYWVIKLEWDNKAIPHQNKFTRECLKPRGLFLQSIYNLCEKCVSYSDVELRTSAWFHNCYLELIVNDVDLLFNCPTIYNNNYKKSFLDVERKKLKELKDYKNPYSTPYLTKLISVSSNLAEQSNVFKNRHYKNFLNSYKGHIDELNSERWGMGYLDRNTGKKWVQGGRGKYGTVKFADVAYDVVCVQRL